MSSPRAATSVAMSRSADVEDAAQRGRLLRAAHDVGDLAQLRARGPLWRGGDGHPDGVAHPALGQPLDALGQGGRKKRGLPRLRGGLEDRLQVLREAEVEHLVRLVEDDRLHPLEHEAAPPHEVEGAPRGGDHHVHAAGEGLGLHAQRLAAVNREHGDPEIASIPVHRPRDLDGELAGGDEDHPPDGLAAAAAALLRPQPLEHGQRKGGRLARARRRLAQHVAPGEQRRDRLTLDRGGLLVAEGFQRLDQPWVEPEVGKGLRRGRRFALRHA
jgi:hypothetical protein